MFLITDFRACVAYCASGQLAFGAQPVSYRPTSLATHRRQRHGCWRSHRHYRQVANRSTSSVTTSQKTHRLHSSLFSCTGLYRPWGFQGFEAPRFQDSRRMKAVRLSSIKKVKVHVWGFFGTAACRPIVPVPRWLPLIHLQRRHAPHRHERPLLAKEGAIQGILLAHS